MTKDYSRYNRKKTRLSRIEEKKSIKQALLFIFLTIILITVLIFLGIPALIRMVVFLGDIRPSDQKPEISDQLSPNQPIIQPLQEATNSASITIKGYAEEGTTIKLIINGQTVKDLVSGKEGDFIFDDVKLSEGENLIKVKAIDSTGNESPFSQQYLVEFDNKPPDLEITSPQDGDKFFDQDKQINITGKTEVNSKVYLNDRLSIANNQGDFSGPIQLNEGENEIKIKVVDRAGNETLTSLKVSYYP